MNRFALLAAACSIGLLAIWIVVPPYTLPLLIASVVAIEFSPFIVALTVIALIFAARSEASRSKTVAIVILAGALLVAVLPLSTLAFTYHPPARGSINESADLAIHTQRIPIDLGGQPAHILAYIPNATGLRPIVITMYGGAFARGGPEKNTDLNRELAKRGYAVFAVDYRHAPRYTFPAQLNDVEQQIAYIRAHATEFSADSNRVALLGHSSGGALAMLAAFRPGARVRAVVSYSGAIDMVGGIKSPPHPDPGDVPRIVTDYLGALPDAAPEAYLAASPIARVRSGSAPILLIYGARDHVVDVRAPRALRDALIAHHDAVTYVEFPWAEHAFEDVPFGLHGGVALRAVEAFLQANL